MAHEHGDEQPAKMRKLDAPEESHSGDSETKLTPKDGDEPQAKTGKVDGASEESHSVASKPQLPPDGYRSIRMDWAIEKKLAEAPHDKTEWRAAMEKAGDGKKDADMAMIRALRAVIFMQTEMTVEAALATSEKKLGSGHQLAKDACTKSFEFRATEPESPSLESPSRPPKDVRVVKKDILDEAGDLRATGRSVAVLNMASARHPGGGFRKGAGAQEENLHRRSDLYRFTEGSSNEYPIFERHLISPNVTVFRGNEKEGYPFLDKPFTVTMISSAAPSKPVIALDYVYVDPATGDKYEIKKYADDSSADRNPFATKRIMEVKIQAILDAAVEAGCDHAVLSAFGCGAMGNPPEAVAEMFRVALEKSKLTGVTFCINPDHNDRKYHNPRGNYEPFHEAFNKRKVQVSLI